MKPAELIEWLQKADQSREVAIKDEDGTEYEIQLIGFAVTKDKESPGVVLTIG